MIPGMTARLITALGVNSLIAVTKMQSRKLPGFNRDLLFTKKIDIEGRLMNHQTGTGGATMVQRTRWKVTDLAVARISPKP